MKTKLKLSLTLLTASLLFGCSSGDSPFQPGDADGVITGIADQDSFTLAFDPINPEAFNFVGETVDVTVRVADRNNNAVPDGAQVFFRTTGGSIEPVCTTENGVCTVVWISQNPKPASGLANVMAYTIGSESFIDTTPNNLFDVGTETVITQLGEAFLDLDNDRVFDNGLETFIDLNNNSAYDAANTLYDGDLCGSSSGCGSSQINIFLQGNIIMSASSTTPGNLDTFTQADFQANGLAGTDLAGTGTTIAIDGSGNFVLSALDINDNPLPEGTTIDIAVVGGTGAAATPSSFTVPNTAQFIYNFAVAGGSTGNAGGSITINITFPSGGTASETIALTVN